MKKVIIFIFVFFACISTYNALSGSLSLTNIYVTGAALDPKFNSQTTQYRVRVKNDVKTVNITATLKDKKSSIISGTGSKQDVIVGNNRFEIKVRDIYKNESMYVVVVSREDEEGNIPSHTYSGLLKTLKIDEYTIFFDSKEFTYNIEVPNNVSELNITTIPMESNLQVEILNNEDFDIGSNEVLINVKNETDIIRTYTINVTKKDVTEISKEKNIFQILKNTIQDPIKVELEVPQMLDGITLEYLVNSEKDVIFEYINDNIKTHSIEVYSANIINKNMDIYLQADINTSFKYKNKDAILLNLRQETFPGKVIVNVYTEGIYRNRNIVELYKKNKDNYAKLTELTVNNDKLSFNTTTGGEYVMVLKDKETIEKEERTKETIIVSILGVLNLLAIIRLIKVMRK